MTGHRGEPVRVTANGEKQVVYPGATKKESDWNRIGHNLRSRFWIACLAIISVCIISALVNFQLEQRSRSLSNKLNLLVAVSGAMNDGVTTAFELAEEKSADEVRLLLDALKANAAELDRLAQSLSDVLPKAGNNTVASLILQLETQAIPGFVDRSRAVQNAIRKNGFIDREVFALAKFANQELLPIKERTSVLVDRHKTQLKDVRILVQGGAGGIIILLVLVTVVGVFHPFERHFSALSRSLDEKARDLRKARHEASSAAIARKEFLTRISHEIRTPLNGMLATSKLLTTSSLTEKQRVLSSTLTETTRNLMGLLGNVITYAELTSCRVNPSLAEVRFSEIVEAIETMCAERSIGKCLDYSLHIDDELPKYVLCDKHSIIQVLSALIDNAFKYTKEGAVTLRVWPKASSKDRSRVTIVFCVQDTGIGIVGEKQRVIFEEFTQVDNSMTRAHDGLGLGLAIASIIAGNSDGRLNMTSVPATGSSFYFELPVMAIDSLESAGMQQSFNTRQRLNIVVVSGVEAQTQALAGKLDGNRFDVTVTRNVDEVVQLTKAANKNRVTIDAVIIGKDILECDNAAFVTASIRNALETEAAVFGFGQWRNWYSTGIFRTVNLSSVNADLLEGIIEKRERMNVTSRAA